MNTLVRRAHAWVFAFACLVSAAVFAAEAAPTNRGNSPWKIHQRSSAQFPPRMTFNGVTRGTACVRISIDTKGVLLDALIISCSHRDFGAEALRTVRRWSYEPEWTEGLPVGIVADIVFDFQMNGPVAVEKRIPSSDDGPRAPRDPLATEEQLAYRAEPMKNIDRVPPPVNAVPPVYPAEWSDRGITGTATVDFYIDETGRARVPVVTSSDHHLLGASAAAAVAQWQFEPPTQRGKPVLVHAVQTFTFQPEKK